MVKKITDVDPKIQKILQAYPVRNPVAWHKERGVAVIIFKKNLTRFEQSLQRRIGGPMSIRRTLDEKGTIIWELCDGRHRIKDICDVMDEKYQEDIEPVFEYVHKVLLMLLERGLIHLEPTMPEKGVKVRKQRVLKKAVKR
ncbi:MAG: PqqD family protein [Thermoplasmata archaeon]|nr:MAG: PqqD family protein [Thermoplasmata archaeon]